MARAVAATVMLFLAATGAGALTGYADSPVGLIDTLGPRVLELRVSQPLVKPNDIVTIIFALSEAPVIQPTVTVNGHPAVYVGDEGLEFTYTYRVRPTDPAGPAQVQVSAVDAAGNADSHTDSSSLTTDMSSLPLGTWMLWVVLGMVGALLARRSRRHPGLLVLVALWAAGPAWGQAPVVSNVQFMQQPRASGGTEVVVTYDLESASCGCDVTVRLSKDGGADGFPFPARSVSGDVSGVAPGMGRRIVWDVAADYPGEHIAQARLRVTAATRPDSYAAWEGPFPGWLFSKAAECQNHLKQVGLACKMFAGNHGGRWPRMSDEAGRLVFRPDEIVCYYLTNPETLTCPGRGVETPPLYFDDKHYVYLGYLLTNDQDVLAFADAYAAEVAAGGDFSGNLAGAASYGTGDTIFRLREGIERYLITDIDDPAANARAQTGIPIMFDWPDNHQAGWGGNVLYMDGHVEFVHYGTKFPMTETTLTVLAQLAGYEPPDRWYTHNPDPYRHSPYFVGDCANRIRQAAVSIKMFSGENRGFLPRLSAEPGRLMAAHEDLYPFYLSNPQTLTCPGVAQTQPPPFFDDPHYAYLGYLMMNDDDVAAFAGAYHAIVAAGGDFSGTLPVTTSYAESMFRLREGIARFLITDINNPGCVSDADIPVLVEWPDNHEGLHGGHVLYLDGHVEWHDYPGKFPMTQNTIGTLAMLADRPANTAWAPLDTLYTPENDPYRFARSCRNNLLQAGLLGRMFAGDKNGVRPSLSNIPGIFMMSQAELHPEYDGVPWLLVCPGPAPITPEPFFDDTHYLYFGYLVRNDADVTALAGAYAAQVAAGGDFSADLPAATSYGDTLLHLRDNIGRNLIIDPETPAIGYVGDHDIPVMMEWPGNHEGLAGGHVLYLDGHVEWHDYPGRFPMTEHTVATLGALADWTPTAAWDTRPFTLENDPYKQALCQFSMDYYLAASLKSFAGNHKGFFPPLAALSGTLMFDPAPRFLPYHLHDLTRLNCPGSAVACQTPVLGDHSYVYLGYAVMNEEDLQAFAAAYRAQLAAGGDFTGNLPGPVSYGDTILRLREGIELLPGPGGGSSGAWWYGLQYTVPVMIEWPDNHGDIRGGNVLYMDGHAEWLDYPGKFPMTESAIAILAELAGRPPVE